MNDLAQRTQKSSTSQTSSSSAASSASGSSRLRESLRGQDYATQVQMLNPEADPQKAPEATNTPSKDASKKDTEVSRLEQAFNAIPPYHVILEQLAHNYAYHSGDLSDVDDLKGKSDAKWLEQSRLKKIGYERKQVVESAATGFQVTLFMPVIEMRGKSADPASLGLPEDLRLRPVLAFRGTDGGPDVTDDANPMGIGSFQFAMHEEEIGALIAKANGSGQGAPDLTGHSLGGALAQRAAARFSGEFHDVVTFQAPGIGDQALTVDPKQHGSTHYMMAGDLVSTSGGAHTPGLSVIMSQPTGNGPATHGAFPLASVDDQRTDGRGIGAIEASSAPIAGMVAAPSFVKDAGALEFASEYLRSGAGLRAMPGSVTNQLKAMDLVERANAFADEYSISQDITPAAFEAGLRSAFAKQADAAIVDQIVHNATLRFERLQNERRG